MRSIGNKVENKLGKNQRTRKGLGLFFKVALPIAFVLFLASVVCYMMFHGTEDAFFQQNLVMFVRGVPAAAVALFFILSLTRKCKKMLRRLGSCRIAISAVLLLISFHCTESRFSVKKCGTPGRISIFLGMGPIYGC